VEVQKLGKAMKIVKSCGIPVVDEAFVHEVGKGTLNMEQFIKKHKISAWGPDVSKTKYYGICFVLLC
jgi:hypothetical protein